MDIWLYLFPFPVIIVVFFFCSFRRFRCPDCGDRLPPLCSPFAKTRRMWQAGGYLCAGCGCETDSQGRKVTADTPLPPISDRQWALLGVLFMVHFVLLPAGLAAAWFYTGRATTPPVIAVPARTPPAIPVR